MRVDLFSLSLVVAWMLSPESLVLLGNSIGMQGLMILLASILLFLVTAVNVAGLKMVACGYLVSIVLSGAVLFLLLLDESVVELVRFCLLTLAGALAFSFIWLAYRGEKSNERNTKEG